MTGMEVWMRRSDRELKDMADIVAIAKRETVCTVAFHDESCPYLIPLNYGAEVEEGKLVLYFHGAKEGTKIDKIRENPQVSYCIYGKNSLKINYDAACKSTTSFESICGNGTAYFVEDLTSKKSSGEPHESDESEEGIRRERVRGGNGERSDGLEDRN